MAISANINRLTVMSFIKVVGSILHATSVRDTVVVCEFIDSTWVSTVARSTIWFAVDDGLGRQSDGSCGSGKAEHDVESIGNSGGGTLRPAGTAVNGNVLVFVPGKVVRSVHVSPVDISRDISSSEEFPRSGFGVLLASGKIFSEDSACLVGGVLLFQK